MIASKQWTQRFLQTKSSNASVNQLHNLLKSAPSSFPLRSYLAGYLDAKILMEAPNKVTLVLDREPIEKSSGDYNEGFKNGLRNGKTSIPVMALAA